MTLIDVKEVETNELSLITSSVIDAPRRTAFDEIFDQLWEEYPRKIGKIDAKKAIKARLNGGDSSHDLMTATRGYAATRRGEDPTTTMHPKTFYGPNERWRDYMPGGAGLVKPLRTKSREQMKAEVDLATRFILDLFNVSRETISRPVENELAEKVLQTTSLQQLGRIRPEEIRALVSAIAYE